MLHAAGSKQPEDVTEENLQTEHYYPLAIPKKIPSDEGSSARYGLGLGKTNPEIPTSEVNTF